METIVGTFGTQPWPTVVAGGALFGGAAGLLMVEVGRIAGVAGVAAGLLRPKRGDFIWRALFVVGLLAGGLLAAHLWPGAFAWHRQASLARVVAAGLLIGVGARVGNGCTSGHGVCGVARLSPRSIVAVTLFTAVGALTHLIDRLAGGGAI
jgi:uncharacterized membrane protein YedE/YeeE